MRVIDRLYQYLEQKHIAPYTFERNCSIANGYLKKQTKGKGSIGSEILEKISRRYSDLSLIWLVTGSGSMTLEQSYSPSSVEPADQQLKDRRPQYSADEGTVRLLREKIAILQSALADKEKIIRLMEAK